MKKHAVLSLIFMVTLMIPLLASIATVHATYAGQGKGHLPPSAFHNLLGVDGYTPGATITWEIHLNVTANQVSPFGALISISNVNITDTLPPYVTYVVGSHNSSSQFGFGSATFTAYPNGTLFWDFGAGPFNASVVAPPPFSDPTRIFEVSVTFNATINSNVPDNTTLINQAVVKYKETVSGVESAPATTDTIWVATPVLDIIKQNPASVNNGANFNYVLTLNNTGDIDATGINVTDFLPSGVTHTPGTSTATSGSIPVDSGTQMVWTGTIGNVTGSHIVTITIPVTANTLAASVFNLANYTAYPSYAQFTHSSANCTTGVIHHPAITVTKTPSATKVESGSTVTYTYNVTNTGDIPLTVSLTDNVFSSPIFTGKVLAPGASNITTVAHVLTANTTNTATAVGVDQTGASVQATASATVRVLHPTISLTKTASPSTPQTGPANFTFTYVVTNIGDVALSGVTVYDQTFNTLILGPVTLSVGQSATGTFGPVTYQNVTGSFTNTANATGTDQTGAVANAFAQATVSIVGPAPPPRPVGGKVESVNMLMVLFAAIEDTLSKYWEAVPAVGAIAALIIFKRRRN